MSYPTARRLQYGGTRAQESAWLRPHVPRLKPCNRIFPRRRATSPADLAAASTVDSVRHPHRMPATCRPEKAARFVFPGLVVDAIERASRRAPTFRDRHGPQRGVAFA